MNESFVNSGALTGALVQKYGLANVTFVTQAANEGQVQAWIKGFETPDLEHLLRLQRLNELAGLIAKGKGWSLAKLWLVSERLTGDVSPAEAIREGRTEGVLSSAEDWAMSENPYDDDAVVWIDATCTREPVPCSTSDASKVGRSGYGGWRVIDF